ncbi:hypothetical protein SRIMM317S_05746 [Streptomyces rimosus subsp. rimosus]
MLLCVWHEPAPTVRRRPLPHSDGRGLRRPAGRRAARRPDAREPRPRRPHAPGAGASAGFALAASGDVIASYPSVLDTARRDAGGDGYDRPLLDGVNP